MLQKLVDENQNHFSFSESSKKSNSKVFNNSRLLVLNHSQKSICYLSKVPDNLSSLKDAKILRKHKQMIKMQQVFSFRAYVPPESPQTLLIAWKDKDFSQPRVWEFTFLNAFLAQKWGQEIHMSLLPPEIPKQSEPEPTIVQQEAKKPQKQKQQTNKVESEVDFSHLTISRFSRTVKQPTDNNRENTTMMMKRSMADYTSKSIGSQDGRLSISTYRQKFGDSDSNRVVTSFIEIQPSNRALKSQESTVQVEDWNTQWFEACRSKSWNKMHRLCLEFSERCDHIVKQIAEELVRLKQERNYFPITRDLETEVYEKYKIRFKLSFPRKGSEMVHVQKPILYTQQPINDLIRQFEDNEECLLFNKQIQFIKIPISCIIHYMGLPFMCVAQPPQNFQPVDATHSDFRSKLQSYEHAMKIKLVLDKTKLYADHTNNFLTFQTKHFKPETLIRNAQIENIILQNNSEQTKIVSWRDLKRELQANRLNQTHIGLIYSNLTSAYLKSIMMTHAVAIVFCEICHSEISRLIEQLPLLQIDAPKQLIVEDCLHLMIDEFFGDTTQVWNVVGQQVQLRFSITIQKQKVFLGYLFSCIAQKIGLVVDYAAIINVSHHFFKGKCVIPRQAIRGLKTVIRNYHCRIFGQKFNEINTLCSEEPTVDRYTHLGTLIQNKNLHNFDSYELGQISSFLSNFIEIGQQYPYSHLKIYSHLDWSTLHYYHFAITLSAIKWKLIKHHILQARQLADQFKARSAFWISESHPFAIKLYETFAEYYRSIKQSNLAIAMMKEVLTQSVKLFGADSPSAIEKHYLLGNLCLNCSLHYEALMQYRMVKKTTINAVVYTPHLQDILCLVAKLYLHLGSIDKCIRNCQQIIEREVFKDSAREFEIYEILIRAFEVQQKQEQMRRYVEIMDYKYSTAEISIFTRLLRILLQFEVSFLDRKQLQHLAQVLYRFEVSDKCEAIKKQTRQQAYRYLRRRSQKKSIVKEIRDCLENIEGLDLELALQSEQGRIGYKLKLSQEWKSREQLLLDVSIVVGFEYALGLVKIGMFF